MIFGKIPIAVFAKKHGSGISRMSASYKNGFRDAPDCHFLLKTAFGKVPKFHEIKIHLRETKKNLFQSLPLKRCKPDYVDCDYAKRNKVCEDWLHPVFDLESLAFVRFLHEFFPAKTEAAAAAENCENKRA